MKKDANAHQVEGLPRSLPVFQASIDPLPGIAVQEHSCNCTVKCAGCRCARGECSKAGGNQREQ